MMILLIMRQHFLLPLFTAFSIFPLWIIEQVFPFPFLIEEVFKLASLTYFKPTRSMAIFSGLIFSLSESFLYLAPILSTGSFGQFFIRLTTTTLLHTTTYTIIYLGAARGAIESLASLIVSIIVHFYFNQMLPQVF